MQYRQYKDSDLQISLLGYGCMRLPTTSGNFFDGSVDFGLSQELIDRAIALGVNYFDSAHFYQRGAAERAMGQALSRYPRDSYVMTTKLPKYRIKDREDIIGVFEEQLARCRTDYFDFYLIHNINEDSYDGFSQAHVIECMQELKQRGLVKRIGFSSHAGVDVLGRFASQFPWDIAQIQLNYFDWGFQNAKRQYEILTGLGIPVAVMEPLRGGRLVSVTPEADKLMKDYAPERSIPSWSLRFAASRPNVLTVLSGMNAFGQIEDNADTMDRFAPITQEEQAILDVVNEILLSSAQLPCTQCRYCVDNCPAKLDVPYLIEQYNSYMISKHFLVLEQLNWLPEERQPKNCVACGVCNKNCPQKIDVRGAVDRLKREVDNFMQDSGLHGKKTDLE
jgi:predicted aldo/keto reductase-like oxidoreductase